MKTFPPTIAELRAALKNKNAYKTKHYFWPTMRATYMTHMSRNCRAYRRRPDVIVSSILVNPMQFSANEKDLGALPKNHLKKTNASYSKAVIIYFAPMP